jgi:rhodanese-related sulfurtransferase
LFTIAMNRSRFLLEAGTLLVVSLIVALVANGMAEKERKMALVRDYPNAMTPTSRLAQATMVQPSLALPADSTLHAEPVNVVELPAAAPEAPAESATVVTSVETAAVSPPVPPQAAPTPAAQPAAPVAASVPPAARATREEILRRFPSTPDRAYLDISGEDVAWLHANGALFLDARRTQNFAEGHIAGARPFSPWESDIDERVKKLFEESRDPAMPIVVYCTGGACEDSHMVAQKLWGMFFENVLVYKDGFPDWTSRGGAVARGVR